MDKINTCLVLSFHLDIKIYITGLSVGGIVNALWDLRGRLEGKPVWKILVDSTPEQIVSLIDFT